MSAGMTSSVPPILVDRRLVLVYPFLIPEGQTWDQDSICDRSHDHNLELYLNSHVYRKLHGKRWAQPSLYTCGDWGAKLERAEICDLGDGAGLITLVIVFPDGIELSRFLDFSDTVRLRGCLFKGQVRPTWRDERNEPQYLEQILESLAPGSTPVFDDFRLFSLIYTAFDTIPEAALRYAVVAQDPANMPPPPATEVESFFRTRSLARWESDHQWIAFTHYSGAVIRGGDAPSWLVGLIVNQYLDLAGWVVAVAAGRRRLVKELSRGLVSSERWHGHQIDYESPRFSEQDQGREMAQLWLEVIERDYRDLAHLREAMLTPADAVGNPSAVLPSPKAPAVDFESYFMLPFTFTPDVADGPARPEDVLKARDRLLSVLTSPDPTLGGAVWAETQVRRLSDSEEYYAEWQYFLPFVRHLLLEQRFLTLAATPWGSVPDDGGAGLWQLGLTLPDGRNIDGLTFEQAYLHLFTNGFGFLAIEVQGQRSRYDDFLAFCEHFRWTGAAYLSQLLPRSLRINGHTFSLFEAGAVAEPSDVPQSLAGLNRNALLAMLLGRRASSIEARRRDSVALRPALDWRLITISWAATPEPIDEIRWRTQLFVDGVGSSPSWDTAPEVERHLLDQHEYRRWWRMHRIGVTRYSAAFLGRSGDGFYCNVVRKHVGSIYYSLALISFMQRTKLVEFNRQLAALASAIAHDPSEPDLLRRMRQLREDYLLFASRDWFLEPTHQDQGAELAAQWMRVLGNDRLHAELKEGIERFDAYFTQRLAERTEGAVRLMTVVFGFVTIWAALMSTQKLPAESWRNSHPWGTALTLAVISAAVLGILYVAIAGTRTLWSRLRGRRGL